MFIATQTIAQKRDGGTLTSQQIADFVARFATGEIPDYQMSALAMAIYLRDMTKQETAAFTESMLASGTRLSWSAGTPIVDKHSTGGSGDKVSLVLAPLLACCGVRVPMISGRGLGPTGGTLDKLESIPGFRTNLSLDEIQTTTERVGCVITGASAEIAPADKKLYALRDVTATVASIPLITASIMSKKLAESLDALVLDVKFGSGAFMKTLEQARDLARSLVDTGKRMGVKTTALLTDMHQPLGRMVGNAVEVEESIDALQGNGPADLTELTIALGCELLVQVEICKTRQEAHTKLVEQLKSGTALEKFREIVLAQGGDPDAKRIVAPASEVVAQRPGYVATIDTEKIGFALIASGGGRQVAADKIDHSVGFEMLTRLGEAVEIGQPLVRIFAHPDQSAETATLIRQTITIDDQPPITSQLIAELVS